MNSTAAKAPAGCSRFLCSIHAFIDGELDPGHAADVETHLMGCEGCAERVALLRSMRTSLKRTASTCTSSALRARIGCAMERERERAAWQRSGEQPEPTLIRLRYAVGLAAAAGIVFAMGMARYRHQTEEREVATPQATDAVATAGFDTLIDDLVSLHAHPLPPETTNPEDIRRWDPLVGVPIRRPAFQPFGGSFHGARVLGNGERRAALLQYTVLGTHRVTVYVFDPRAVPVQQTRLHARLIRQRSVYVGQVHGYSVAAAEQQGVGYALATDLGDDESTQMMLAAIQ